MPPLCNKMMSFSVNFSLVSGWSQSFLMTFSTQSIVTTSPVVLSTANGMEFVRTSRDTAHTYGCIFPTRFVLSAGSASVNFTSMRSLALNGSPLTGQKIVLIGFWSLALPESGVCEGHQKAGSWCFLSPSMFERRLGPAWSKNGEIWGWRAFPSMT